jgi:hypothetical protein
MAAFPLMAHQAMEHVELARRQQDFGARAVRNATVNVENQVSYLPMRGLIGFCSSDQRPDAC